MTAILNKDVIPWDSCDEVYSESGDFLEENRHLYEEIQYIPDYIHQKGMDTEFAQFQQDAQKEQGADLPFPRLVMDTVLSSHFIRNTLRIIYSTENM